LVPGAGFSLLGFESATSGLGRLAPCSPDYESLGGHIGLARDSQHQEIDYKGLRDEFIAWLRSKGLNKYYAKGMVSCLDRHVKDKQIKEAMDARADFSIWA